MEEIGVGLFRPFEPVDNPERVQFLHIANAKAQLVLYGGRAFERFKVD